jgi:predicted dehydrogenase
VTHSWQSPQIDASAHLYRVGAIGAGAHATTAVWPELAAAGFVLEAVCSRSIDRARAAAARFGVPHAFDDAARMLSKIELDGLIVVVPQDAFAPYVRLAITRGTPLFVEKPAADNPREALELADEAAAAGAKVVVGYQKRFAHAYRQAKEQIASDGFGRPTLATFKWAMGPFHRRFDLRGWLLENPVHHFDLARYFLGELSELGVKATESAGEYAIVATARSDSGTVVSIQANTTASWEQESELVEIFGEGSSVAVKNVDTFIFRPAEGLEQVSRPNYTVPAYRNFSGETLGFGAELRHFRDVIEGVDSQSDLASAAATLRLAGEIADLAGA